MSTGGNTNTNNSSSFASAATGLKGSAASAAANSNNPNVKISSAELLSMLKKPSAPSGPSVNSNIAVSSTNNVSVPPETARIIPPFKDDDYTLQGLINLIKACQSNDRNIFALGVDLENDIGLAMNQEEPLRHSLLSPWYDESLDVDRISSIEDRRKSCGLLGLEGSFTGSAGSSAHNTPDLQRKPSALETIIPGCYHVPSLPPSTSKLTSFADETLFYIFYAMPADKMQELAARELFARGWRFFKPAKSWICPVETGAGGKDLAGQFSAALKGPVNFFVFDQSTWIKVKRSLTLQPEDLEFSRPLASGTASPISSPEIMHGSGTLHSTSVTH